MKQKLFGLHGKILYVDLTNKKIREELLEPDIFKVGVGGIGLAMQLLYKLADPKKGSFHEDTPIIFATGPLTRTSAPSSGAYLVLSQSPMNGMVARGMANGFFGAKMKGCGYDAVVFTGKSDKPVYFWLSEQGAELRDASNLWGCNNFETEEKIISATNPKASVATIGRAGENQVPYAFIQSDHGHIAASGGIGAVMGSKKLKAFAAYGNHKTAIYDSESMKKIVKDWVKALVTSPAADGFRKYGTANFVDYAIKIGDLPIKNFLTNDGTEYGYIAGHNMRKNFEHKVKPCYRCPVSHVKWIKMPEGNKYGLNWVEEPEYEGLDAFGPFICNKNLNSIVYLNYLCDDYGMDYKNLAPIIALCIECSEEGLLRPEDLNGIELKWGDGEAVGKLIEAIGNREGNAGELLSGNIRDIAERIGGDAPSRAIHVKGGGIHLHDMRSIWGMIVSQVTTEFCNTTTGSHISMSPVPEFGYPTVLENSGENVDLYAEVDAKLKIKNLATNMMVLCDYCVGNAGVPIKTVLDAATAVTGCEFTYDSTNEIVYRTINLARIFNLRAGLTAADDIPSERLMMAPPDGPVKGITIKPYIKDIIRKYYENMGWDAEGKPLPETLKKLKLEHVIPDLSQC